jgi:hypothetical protein
VKNTDSSQVCSPALAAKLLLTVGCAALIAACGGGGSAALPQSPGSQTLPAAVTPLVDTVTVVVPPNPVNTPTVVIDPLTPVVPVDFASAQASFAVASDGVGGDGAGDAGVGGAAGDGAALRRATIVLTDNTGKTLSGQTDDAGNYLIRYKSADIKPPFVMKVIDAGGNVLAAPSEATVPVGKVARININPLTDKLTSDILAASIPGTDKQFNGSNLNLAALPT